MAMCLCGIVKIPRISVETIVLCGTCIKAFKTFFLWAIGVIFSYRVCHEFGLPKRNDYFWVNFEAAGAVV